MSEKRQEVGIVKALYRYPVKSMKGEAVAETHVGWHGLDGDRRYAFVRGDIRSSFPWLSARQVPEMLTYVPRFTDPSDIVNSAVEVLTPNGRSLPVTSPELLAELAEVYGADVSLINIGRGAFDSIPLSVMSMATAEALNADFHRFRQNIVFETASGEPFAEEAWVGQALVFGDGARIRLNRRIPRCVMVNLDAETAVSNPTILKNIVQTRDNCVGVHASTEMPGHIAVGNAVYLER